MMTVEEHYNAIAPRLVNWLVASGLDRDAAYDVLQETFLRVWKMRDELSDDPSQVSGLVWTIARNLRNDRARKLKREVLQDEIREEDSGTVEPETSPGDAEYFRQRIDAALATLPPLLREAFTMFQVGELSIREISEQTGVSESLVKVRIFRAKEKLRPLLKDLL